MYVVSGSPLSDGNSGRKRTIRSASSRPTGRVSYSSPAGVGNGVGVSPGRAVGSRSIFDPWMWKNLATAVRLAGTPSTTATTTAAAAPLARTSGRRRTFAASVSQHARPLEQSETSRPGTDFVQPKIRDDAQQPRTERLALTERAQLAIGTDKCLLRHVLRRRRVAHDEIRGAKCH